MEVEHCCSGTSIDKGQSHAAFSHTLHTGNSESEVTLLDDCTQLSHTGSLEMYCSLNHICIDFLLVSCHNYISLSHIIAKICENISHPFLILATLPVFYPSGDYFIKVSPDLRYLENDIDFPGYHT